MISPRLAEKELGARRIREKQQVTERGIISLLYEKNSFNTLSPQSMLKIRINLSISLSQSSTTLSPLQGLWPPSQRAYPTL